ncbi:MAG: tRNA pseudouridine(55) synthase TruB [Tenericutes bacterium 4572_104]|nr:MAG: tRNA pseudouridine(55) synthase TruB [Tenericutes bacterium 4572_104]
MVFMDGVLIINKPKSYTSHDIVDIARKVLMTRRIGHIGTLDPNATGVLVLCVNKATKLVKYFENHSKTYIATIRLGIQTDTDDITGKVVKETKIEDLKEEDVLKELKTFKGKQEQIPPKYSAIKINGRKLYELARRDLTIPPINPRTVEIYSIDKFKHLKDEPGFTFQIRFKVSKGTYIRSIARDLGERLGVYGTLVELERTRINQFTIEEAIDLETFKQGKYELKDPFKYMDLNKHVISPEFEHYVRHGRFIDPDLVPEKKDVILYSESGEPLAIYYYDEQKNQMRMSVKWC